MSLRAKLVPPILVLAAAAAVALTPGAARADHIHCGHVVTHDFVLTHDLECGGADVAALVIGAHGITVDLGGHTLTGSHGDDNDGVRNNGYDDVTIKNGLIREFERGVYLIGADENRVRKLALSGNGGAIALLEGGAHKVERNRISGNFTGIRLDVSHGNLIRRNTMVGVGLTGLSLSSSDGNLIESNKVDGGGAADPDFTNGVDVDGHDNRLKRNRVVRNAQDGIAVSAASTGTLLERNQAHRNGDDGIDVNGPSARITANSAHRNRDLGIEAPPGVTDGGGNKAIKNGNPAQCTGVRCSRP
jgi:parallel beta-helix repeat protein